MSCDQPPLKTSADLLRDRAADRPVATLSEVFSETAADGAVTGFTLANLDPAHGPLLWIMDRITRKECGIPYLAGFPREWEVIRVDVSRPVDVLWSAEQGLGTPALGGVIAEVWGDPPVLDFTATKRLALRAEANGVPCWLLRRAAQPALSAARERWRVSSLPSGNHPWDSRAPGQPHWKVELFRSRFRAPGTWVARYDAERHHMDLDPPVAQVRTPDAAAV
ncbi:ImuA family protein [Histidinibacterium aquaticum]|uniref:Protein ImuA n=1 Tax=Histidinibacterium aquaticum TaxID=2613962 RepID=A0A5J5GLX8_9RHOB|nr:hypothetical protein [Histidinibacterium aquaticum]KAA9009366.1 hypothetical protein F3S47_08970 [Histidinibacterium aquaticum]